MIFAHADWRPEIPEPLQRSSRFCNLSGMLKSFFDIPRPV
jgi:hypothetical protein